MLNYSVAELRMLYTILSTLSNEIFAILLICDIFFLKKKNLSYDLKQVFLIFVPT